MFWRKLKIFIQDHWMAIAIIATVVIVVILTWIGMSLVDSYFRRAQLATMPTYFLIWIVGAVISAFIYVSIMFGAFGKVDKKLVKAQSLNIHFSDVVGLDEAKQEAWEVVELIKDRAKLKAIGGKILRGILMIGPPGCGKTYLAKAIATEAGVPFLSMGASEFNEVFVGVGASRVRGLFKKARRFAYTKGACIIFIDELDAIGHARTFSFLGGGETNATLNQLLIGMDGLGDAEENVVVIGATNAAEGILDKALLRPGRFDRKLYIDRPGLDDREKLFRYYLSKVKHDPAIEVGKLARKTVYKTPADIENIIKESALIATRNKKDIVSYKELSEAMERIDLGIKHKRKMFPHEREMIAYHESGHLVTLYLIHPTDDVFKASIISRGETLGVIHHQPREEFFTQNKDELLADIKVSLSGYIAEKIKYGSTSTGVAMDFKTAMAIAHNMAWSLGMSAEGIVGDYTIIPDTQLSEDVKKKLNDETQEIFNKCYKDAETVLKKEWNIVERFVKELLKKDELEYDEIEAIFKEYGKTHVWSDLKKS